MILTFLTPHHWTQSNFQLNSFVDALIEHPLSFRHSRLFNFQSNFFLRSLFLHLFIQCILVVFWFHLLLQTNNYLFIFLFLYFQLHPLVVIAIQEVIREWTNTKQIFYLFLHQHDVCFVWIIYFAHFLAQNYLFLT